MRSLSFGLSDFFLKPAMWILAVVVCWNTSPATAATVANASDQQFAKLAKTYIEQNLSTHPEAATQLGDHRFDKRSNDLSRRAVMRDVKLYEQTLAALSRIPEEKLSLGYRVDYRILRDDIRANLFSIQVLREYEWDPLAYNPANGVYLLLARNFAPLPKRLADVGVRLNAFPAKLAAAKANLKNPPRIHTETAIEQNKGVIGLVRDELEIYLKDAPEMKPKLAASRTRAIQALEDYGVWLQQTLLPRSTSDFRLGAEKYQQKLRFALESDLTPETILQNAEADLVKTQAAMYETAAPLYPRFFANATDDAIKAMDRKALMRAVLTKLADDHPNNDNVVKLAEQDLAEAAAFIREKKLLTLPSDPVKVIVMPEFQRGVAMAYCDPAGALEKNGETFYAISPAPRDWTPAQIESYFREDNRSMLKDLTVHEAMPGHYVQGILANKAKPPTLVRNVTYSGTFSEGWATYAEQMMVEAGYGGAAVKMQQLKMRLRLIINAIIDQKIHAGNMTEKEAMAMMTDEGFQEEREAAGKWRRALLTSTQLSTYYVGNLEINGIRDAYEAKYGKGKLGQMHDEMLSHGTISAKYVRELMGL